MIEGIFYRPSALSTLALVMMSGVPTLYLLTIRSKSRDGWMVLGLYGVFTLFFMSNFIRDITRQTPLFDYIARWPEFHLSLVAFYLGWFSYSYRKVHFRLEMYIVLTVEILVAAFGLISPIHPPLVYPIGVIGSLWSSLVLLRKSWLANGQQKKINENPAARTGIPWVSQLLQESSHESRAYRVFAAWYFYFFLLAINFNLMIYGILPLNSIWMVIHQVLFLTLITWLLINLSC